jgi:hypothetical protein
MKRPQRVAVRMEEPCAGPTAAEHHQL